ncbi:hypothetical protein YPPY66_1698 [Yersinia pestis PY-66]|uniref:Rtn protein n=2 Tax=Yersinia pestis TaxID=632 RepID=A0AAX2I0S7_YERPE|nr:hypothetical protein YPC_2923 [Yersinia pestis biovar Medievalis str. Harbin 35]AJI89474.1 rtn domain protein [Yersinia pestis]AJI99633.1 rtn domain protein [Yersinia pestis Pestoides F]AJJ75433.1 rtn domain protein [Yersinia pestis A1122]AJJ78667.1 rtn domain protein [Yersinia pestis Antiqua]AJJ85320.1 rtn domain protein [Yersinia pestis Angola]AJJ88465.1 rtn domain protein [Yersinia pestis CO92]AJK14212.1 rtn domain protein [Yersinia pestis str. Pestoides B]AJK24664.1 rtn domain protei
MGSNSAFSRNILSRRHLVKKEYPPRALLFYLFCRYNVVITVSQQ